MSGMTLMRCALPPALALSLCAASPVPFTDLATPFERVAVATAAMPEATRIAAVRRTIDPLLPGVYDKGPVTDRRIARALASFPAEREAYDRAVRTFPADLTHAVERFRTVFPGFASPLPIYLYHSLGVRDGGTADIEPGHRPVMLFGADMIVALHTDASLEPFLDHELFHLEHARAFTDCDRFWCALWQEGLAVDAAATMNPGATDHQLLLDVPATLRPATDERWTDALCFVAAHFDDSDEAVTAQALQLGGEPPHGLPARFGYYVGFRIAQATGRPIVALDRLDHQAARPLVRATLVGLMTDAKATCALPATDAATTRRAVYPD